MRSKAMRTWDARWCEVEARARAVVYKGLVERVQVSQRVRRVARQQVEGMM